MKIKEALKIINATDTVSAKADGDDLLMYQRDKIYLAWFLRFPTKANNWSAIAGDWHGLLGVYTQDLARVMDVIQRLLDTPVEERFPEKKYRLRWINDQGRCKNYLNLNSNGAWVFMDDEIYAEIFTESELEQLKTDNPRLAPAIDAMKEPVEDKDDE